jgi:hypothetical protein
VQFGQDLGDQSGFLAGGDAQRPVVAGANEVVEVLAREVVAEHAVGVVDPVQVAAEHPVRGDTGDVDLGRPGGDVAHLRGGLLW